MAILNIHDKQHGCLPAYIQKNGRKVERILPGPLAQVQNDEFKERLENLTLQMDAFLDSDKRTMAYLVLGKVQSGKTSHLIGTLAYASGSPFALASIFTGVNGALNAQGFGRVETDLSEQCIRVFSVPTNPNSKAYKQLFSDVKLLIQNRLNQKLNGIHIAKPMPVLVTMKNRKRVETLAFLMDELGKEFGRDLAYLMVDDEADQASQNAAAHKEELAATYKAIADLRKTNIRHIMLSYTATPQAVLLAEKQGFLRPDRCVTIPPRYGYFGLNEITDPDFGRNLIEVDDVLSGKAGNPSTWVNCPDSLSDALTDFYLGGLIRRLWPKVFYAKSLVPFEQLEGLDTSTQMLIHQSVNVKEHTEIFNHVVTAKKQLSNELLEFLTNGSPLENIPERWASLLSRIEPYSSEVPEQLGIDELSNLYDIIDATRFKIVNGDSKNPTVDVEMPVTATEWNAHEAWIMIGGEILGRGLTIPQLTTTYFLRTAKKSNFDTVSQQMRFCGYRRSYSHLVTLHAPQDTLEKFNYMRQIEATVWRYASRWDSNKTDISKNIPPILYAAPLSANLEPTRKNVRDPYLIDQRIDEKGRILKSLTTVFNPADIYSNIRTLQSWTLTIGQPISVDSSSNWATIESLAPKKLKELIAPWSSGDAGGYPLRGIAELYTPEMEELGLGEMPITVFVKSGLLKDSTIQNPTAYFTGVEAIERAVHNHSNLSALEEWAKHFQDEGNKLKWPTLQTPHVGDTQRAMVDGLEYTGTVVMIEPVLGHAHKNKSVKVGFGLALTIFKPQGYEVRMMGHA